MRKDGTHSERELKQFDRDLRDRLNDLIVMCHDYAPDNVGLLIAYARPKDSVKENESSVIGVKRCGRAESVEAALTVLFDVDPDLFFEVLKNVSELHPDIFRMCVVRRPKRDTTLS